MRLGRLTFWFALLGALVADGFVGVWWATHSGSDSRDQWVSQGDLMVIVGLIGLVLGAAFGLVVWAVWRLSSWVERRYY
jgi:hypothetical protein